MRLTRRQLLRALASVPVLSRAARAQSSTTYQGMTIPHSRPRIWFDATRLATAQAWWNAGGAFTPSSGAYSDYALSWLLSGNTSHRDTAKNWLLNTAPTLIVVPPVDGVDRNYCRWAGWNICACYDWLWSELTAGERSACRAYWNAAFAAVNSDCDTGFPGPAQFANNYFNGYIRNSILWGIASIDETPTEAQALLDWGFGKFEGLKTYVLNAGRGGVGVEGAGQYGRYPFYYGYEWWETATLYGRDIWAETDWFLQNAIYWIHNLTPGLTYYQGSGTPIITLLPHGDDDYWDENVAVNSEEVGSVWYYYMLHHGAANGLSRKIRKAYDDCMTGTKTSGHVRSLTPAVTPASDYADWPFDFYASGNGYLVCRKAWDTSSAVCRIMVGPHLEGVQHYHADPGDFLLWRGGRWLTRETTNYNDVLNLYGSSGARAAMTNGTYESLHNVLLVNGLGGVVMPPYDGPPVVQRLESGPHHVYVAADLTESYHCAIAQPSHPERGNPAAIHVVREFVWIRPFETLVIFDRIEAASAGQVKTFLLHHEVDPTGGIEDAATIRLVAGAQTLRVTTVLPTSASRSITYEGSPRGQYRVDIEQSGSIQQYFLHVLQARDTSGPNLTIEYDGDETNHVLELAHPTLGYARIEFGKGIAAAGGGFAYNLEAFRGVTPFRSDVQAVAYSAAGGCAWQGPGRSRHAGGAVRLGGPITVQ